MYAKQRPSSNQTQCIECIIDWIGVRTQTSKMAALASSSVGLVTLKLLSMMLMFTHTNTHRHKRT